MPPTASTRPLDEARVGTAHFPAPATRYVLWTLIRLRHKLIWAQVRTSAGRRILFVAGCLVGASFLLLLQLGGTATALFAALLGREEATARWILAGLWVNGVLLSLMLGRGAPPASLEAALRRYPMTQSAHACARYLSGLLDPIWLAISAAVGGLGLGCAMTRPASIPLGLPAVLLFIGICYLSSLLLVSVADRLLSFRGGGTVTGAVIFLLFVAAALLGGVAVDPARDSQWRAIDQLLRLLPPGAAASLIAGADFRSGCLDALTLLLWSGFLAGALRIVHRQPFRDRPVTAISGIPAFLCESIAGLFGCPTGPLVGKALRYHLRCDRVRFSLAGAAPLILLLPQWMGKGGGHYRALLTTMALMFLAALLATASITLNQFGYDGHGVLRYWVLPVPATRVLLAASISSLLPGGVLILAVMAGLPFLAGFRIDTPIAVMLASSAVAGLLLFNAIGLWTSVFSPRKSSFRGVVGNDLSVSANVTIGLGTALTLAAAFALENFIPAERFPELWWAAASLPVVSAVFYLISCRYTARLITARRELLTAAVSGPERL